MWEKVTSYEGEERAFEYLLEAFRTKSDRMKELEDLNAKESTI